MLEVILKISVCACLTLIQFKVVIRRPTSKTRLAQIFLNVVDVCDRRGGSHYNLPHMFFSCPAVTNLGLQFASTPCLFIIYLAILV